MIVVVCTVNGRCLPVMAESVAQYTDWKLLASCHRNLYLSFRTQNRVNRIVDNESKNFGDAYNAAIADAFAQNPDADGLVIANDDCVMTPSSARLLEEDVALLKSRGVKLGLVAARADWIRPQQNIRLPQRHDDEFVNCRWKSEDHVLECPIVAPVFAWISRAAFEAVKFPPLNQGSDDVMSLDLGKLGFRNFISRAYVHHVGAVHTGHDYAALNEASKPWVRANRPDYFRHLFGEDPT